jgi:hypothetical protein
MNKRTLIPSVPSELPIEDSRLSHLDAQSFWSLSAQLQKSRDIDQPKSTAVQAVQKVEGSP